MAGGTPLLFSSAGPQATPPATLQQALITLVAAMVPGYTASLPGSLIEDLSSTGTGILATIDQARVDAVNNVTPYGANPYVLAQLATMFGIPQGVSANANALVVFTGSVGYVIPPGFVVSDGTNQYAVQDGGTIATGGTSQPLYVVATTSGTFAIPAFTITQIVTSVPAPYTLTVTNPAAGVPATAAETLDAYRARVINAFGVSIQGTPTYLKTLLNMIPGVSSRLVSILQSGANWEVVCGGGDPYQIAGAIYAGVAQIGLLTGSSVSNARNVNVSIYDAPNTYNITYVSPPQQTVTVSCVWNTTLPNFYAAQVVNQYIVGAIIAYINSIIVGAPINLLVLQEQVQAAVSSVLAPVNLTTLQFTFEINGEVITPTAGTSVIVSDPESYFFISASGATSAQG